MSGVAYEISVGTEILIILPWIESLDFIMLLYCNFFIIFVFCLNAKSQNDSGKYFIINQTVFKASGFLQVVSRVSVL